MNHVLQYGATREQNKQAQQKCKTNEPYKIISQKVTRKGIKLNGKYFFNENTSLHLGQQVLCHIFSNRMIVFNRKNEPITEFQL